MRPLSDACKGKMPLSDACVLRIGCWRCNDVQQCTIPIRESMLCKAGLEL